MLLAISIELETFIGWHYDFLETFCAMIATFGSDRMFLSVFSE